MKQILIIHGGESFSSYDAYLNGLKKREIDYDRLKIQKKWRQWIAEQLPEADVLLPTFPNGDNAVFDEWKIYFEKLIPFLNNDVHIIGHSLGAMFLAKYLHDFPLPQKVSQVILVAPGYDDETSEDLGSFKIASAKNLPLSTEHVHLFHSKDDFVVPFSEMAKFRSDLPEAHAYTFTDKGHFLDETFPELLSLLK